MKVINSQNLPESKGHYSTAIVSNHTLYVSGQLAIDNQGNHCHQDSFEKQFEVIFENITLILLESGSSPQQVVKVVAYLADIELWPRFNALFKAYFKDHKPVRTVVPVPALHYAYKLEVELIAEVN